jgi:molybdenum cofactor sulfurtransferase
MRFNARDNERVSEDPRLADILQRYPQYSQTHILDELRASEYQRLDQTNHVYLDYTGAALYSDSQVAQHLELLRENVFGNPHSANPTSIAMTDLVERTRGTTLDYFGARDNYHLVFTLNASGALKLAGEAFPFTKESRFLATYDNHNSVNGIREFARSRGAQVTYSPLRYPDLRIDEEALEAELEVCDRSAENLFAFPAQSNYSGVRHSLDWVAPAKAKGWRVLLDAAAFVPTNPLDLSLVKPDFVSISFYKMFGYPAGLGALLIHKEALPILKRPWFAGGTVNFTTVQQQTHVLSQGEAAFEDGTINYLSIPAVEIGLAHLRRIGMDTIQTRMHCLTGHLLAVLQSLRHQNGKSLVQLHGPTNTESRGGTVTFNLYDPEGLRIDYRRIEELAGEAGISLRTGCFCNPGANEAAERLNDEDIRAGLELGGQLNLPNFVKLMDERGSDKSAGAVRVSMGLATNVADLNRLEALLRGLLDRPRQSIGMVSVEDDSCRVIRDGS